MREHWNDRHFGVIGDFGKAAPFSPNDFVVVIAEESLSHSARTNGQDVAFFEQRHARVQRSGRHLERFQQRRETWYFEKEPVGDNLHAPILVQHGLRVDVVEIDGHRGVIVDQESWTRVGQIVQADDFVAMPDGTLRLPEDGYALVRRLPNVVRVIRGLVMEQKYGNRN